MRLSLHRPLASALLVAVVLVVDGLLAVTSPPRVVLGLLDEPAHLATAALVLGTVAALRGRPLSRPLLLAALAASVLIDVDHVPMDLFGSDVVTEGTRRPYSHSLTTPLVLAAVAGLLPRGRSRLVLTGAALGVLLHLWRDLATGGASLLWPALTTNISTPYGLYAASLVLAGIVSARRRR